jgi:hypothetical protein
MRADEPGGGWDQNDPQTFNLYSYVRNSPTTSIDPDGHDCVYVGSSISVVRGDCISDKDNGIYVNGTVDLNSFTYNPKNSSIGFSYTPDDAAPGTFGTGVIQQTPPRMDNGAASPGFLGPADVFFVRVPDLGIMSKIGELLGFGAKETTTVIGKMADLQAEGAIKEGEHALADDLADMGSPKANWAQNSGKLREVMSKGKPIRDASAGKPGSNTGFLRMERNVLKNHGWTQQGEYWVPPSGK